MVQYRSVTFVKIGSSLGGDFSNDLTFFPCVNFLELACAESNATHLIFAAMGGIAERAQGLSVGFVDGDD